MLSCFEHVMIFDVETLDQIRAPAKRAVEKLPVSPFQLEMAASSTRAGELGLESQGLLAENSETPRLCSACQDVVYKLLLLYFIALAVSGMWWQWFTGLELGAYSFWCILLCQWIWFGNFPDMSLVVFGLVICALPFGAFALTTTPSCNLVGPLLALGVFCTIWITQHLLRS